MSKILLAVVIALILASSVMAQDATGAARPAGPTGETVPSWVFYWLLGLGTTIAGALVTALKVLYTRATQVEKEYLERYEGDPKIPNSGVMPQLRAACEQEKADLRTAITQLRTRCESVESARREDSERFRLSELENLRAGMTTLQDVGTALQANTRELHGLVVEIRQGP